jgi:hypothetical protein
VSSQTTDAELNELVGNEVGAWTEARDDHASEWLGDRQAVRALVSALPKCALFDEDAKDNVCGRLAFYENWDADYRCEKHRDNNPETDWTPALRALLERMRGWEERER